VVPRNRSTSYIDRIFFQNHPEQVRAVTLGSEPYTSPGYLLLLDPIEIRLLIGCMHWPIAALPDSVRPANNT
jgi:hypothetical protein